MDKKEIVRSTCPACGSADAAFVFIGSGFPRYRCNSCGCIYVYPTPQHKETADYYKEVNPLSKCCWSESIDQHAYAFSNWKKLLDLAKKYSGTDTLLDIGCGSGQFLAFAKNYGCRDLAGVEIAPEASEIAKRVSGAKIYNSDIFEISLAPESFAVIVIFDVIEHFSNPSILLKKAFSLLRPGGVIAIGTINCYGFSMRILGKYSIHMNREHLTLFGKRALSQALRSAGFEVRKHWTSYVTVREWMRFLPWVDSSNLALYLSENTAFHSGIEKSKIILIGMKFADYLLRLTNIGDHQYIVGQKPF